MKDKNKAIGYIVKYDDMFGIVVKVVNINLTIPFFDYLIFDLKNKQFMWKWAEGCTYLEQF